MKLITYRHLNTERIGLVDGDEVVRLGHRTLGCRLDRGALTYRWR